jgi:hypothetical protein
VMLRDSHPDLGTLTQVLVLLGSHVLAEHHATASTEPNWSIVASFRYLFVVVFYDIQGSSAPDPTYHGAF